MLVAAAVCPHPPLLVPELASGAAAEVAELRESCLAAVRGLIAPDHDQLVVVGTGPAAGTAPPGAAGSLAEYGVDLRVALGPTATPETTPPGTAPSDTAPSDTAAPGEGGASTTLPLSVTVGVWLLRTAGHTGSIRARVVTEHATPAECAALGGRIAAFPGRTALLVMGDGSARREPRAPGHVDPRAVAFDRAATAALAHADLAAFADLDPELARALLAVGRAPWQILAGAAAASGPGPASWRGELLHASAPYGVAYLVARWTPSSPVPA